MAWYKMKRFTRIIRIKRNRKSSNKSDKGLELNDTDSEMGNDSMATRSQAKTSLLSGTSFCCASGQKEDYLPEAKIIPPRKRPPNVAAKQIQESSTPSSPLAPPGKNLKNRRGRIIESNSEDTISQVSETGLIKLGQEDVKIRPLGDTRLRPPDQRGRNNPSSPHRKISRDPLPFHRENSDTKKPPDLNRKLRKDASPRIIPREIGGKKSKDNSVTLENCTLKENDTPLKPSRKTSTKCEDSVLSSVCSGSQNIPHPNSEIFDRTNQTKNYHYNICDASAILPIHNAQESVDNSVIKRINSDKINCLAELLSPTPQNFTDSVMTNSDVMKNSHDSNDFDCPCCDRGLTQMDGPMSDSEINVFTTCEVVAMTSQQGHLRSDGVSEKEEVLKLEVNALREDLQAEKLKLKTQEDRVHHLEEDLTMG